jgi:hypothetical protein
MEVFQTLFLGNLLQDWLIAAGIALATLMVLRGLQDLVRHKLMARAERTGTRLDDLANDLVGRTMLLFLLLVGLYLGRLSLEQPDAWDANLRTIVVVGLWIQAGFWGAGLIHYFISTRIEQEESEEDAAGVTTVSALGAAASVVP